MPHHKFTYRLVNNRPLYQHSEKIFKRHHPDSKLSCVISRCSNSAPAELCQSHRSLENMLNSRPQGYALIFFKSEVSEFS